MIFISIHPYHKCDNDHHQNVRDWSLYIYTHILYGANDMMMIMSTTTSAYKGSSIFAHITLSLLWTYIQQKTFFSSLKLESRTLSSSSYLYYLYDYYKIKVHHHWLVPDSYGSKGLLKQFATKWIKANIIIIIIIIIWYS